VEVVVRRRLTRATRDTVPGRTGGRRNFDSTTSNGGLERPPMDTTCHCGSAERAVDPFRDFDGARITSAALCEVGLAGDNSALSFADRPER
jgi:hypothetical protein